MKSSKEWISGGLTLSWSRCSPSDSMVTVVDTAPLGRVICPMAVTVPETLEWIGAETN